MSGRSSDRAPVSVVTGAAGALGTAVVRRLLDDGHRVVALDLSVTPLEALAGAHPGAIRIAELDATAPGGWERALGEAAGLGPPTGAVLCAGGWAGGAAVHEEADDAAFRRMLSVNLDTAQAALRALLPGMVERQRGSVVLIGSRAAERPWESAGAAAYAAAKAAVVAYARAAAAEVLPHGVRVNAVLPSLIDTPANRAAMPEAEHERWVAPASLAGVIAFLLSDDAKDVSGAAIPVYGSA